MTTYTKAQVTSWLDRMSDGMLDLRFDNVGFADAALEYLGPAVDVGPPVGLQPGQLTPHFTLAELIHSDTADAMGIDNSPTPDEIANLHQVAEMLEQVRAICGDNPVTITSGFRSEALNVAVGGVPNSAHRKGLAADFIIPDFGTPTEVCNELLSHMSALGLDQLINEKTGGHEWVHVGLTDGTPRFQALTITDAGTQVGIV